jgi:gluconate 2-dehydrogenase gamma chain
MPWSPGMATPSLPVHPGPWMFFAADEASLIETVG